MDKRSFHESAKLNNEYFYQITFTTLIVYHMFSFPSVIVNEKNLLQKKITAKIQTPHYINLQS